MTSSVRKTVVYLQENGNDLARRWLAQAVAREADAAFCARARLWSRIDDAAQVSIVVPEAIRTEFRR